MSGPAEPRLAASALVLRDGAGELEVLFVRRSIELKFMAGAWVFPGGSLDPEDGDAAADLSHRRCAVRETEEEAGISGLDPSDLVPYSRWITPELAPIRFDTRFYLCAGPNDTVPTPDGHEVDRAEWWTPSKAIDLFVNETEELHFPTIKQIERLAEFRTVDAALAAARDLPVVTILPRIASSDEGFEILLPGDPGYEEAA